MNPARNHRKAVCWTCNLHVQRSGLKEARHDSRKPARPGAVACAGHRGGRRRCRWSCHSGGLTVDRFIRMMDGPTVTTPGSFTWSLDQGTWLISQRTGSSASAGPLSFTKDNAPTLIPGEIAVKAPGGEICRCPRWRAKR